MKLEVVKKNRPSVSSFSTTMLAGKARGRVGVPRGGRKGMRKANNRFSAGGEWRRGGGGDRQFLD